MSNVETLKALVAPFLQLNPAQIGAQTVIDRRAVKGSIMVHRMFAVLEREGFVVPDRKAIGTFGELAAALGREQGTGAPVETALPALPQGKKEAHSPGSLHSLPHLQQMAIGVDIEEVASMPAVSDFREDPFYRQNFSAREIAYCILQPHPLQSFAGRFCAKEAIVKADQAWRDMPFHQMEILSDAAGAPCFEGFAISIAHTPTQAVAVALKVGHPAHGSAQ
jgi:phosphopantetheine--protein transferase-like protein